MSYTHGLYNLVHSNHRINLHIKDENYIHKEPLFAKLSINVDYLAFLQELDAGLDQDRICCLYDIDPNKILKLKSLGSYMDDIIDKIFLRGGTFNQYQTNVTMKEDIRIIFV